MPRASQESISAASFRAGGLRRPAPAYLKPEAVALWDRIVQSRPVDFFRDGSFELLEQYVVLTVAQKKLLAKITAGRVKDSAGSPYIKQARALVITLRGLAASLRLSVQSDVDRKDGILTENTAPVAEMDRLLGGHAVWAHKEAAGEA